MKIWTRIKATFPHLQAAWAALLGREVETPDGGGGGGPVIKPRQSE